MSDHPFVYEQDERAETHASLPDQARSVLDVGCGAGGYGRALRRRYGPQARVVGLEPHPDGAEAARATGAYDAVLQGRCPEDLPDERFDLVVYNDVLEHLEDPWATLRRTLDLVTEEGVVLATIPNVQYLPVLWDLARRARFDYTDTGVLDRTHLRFFTWKSALDLFLATGWTPVRVEGVNSAFAWPPYARFARLQRLTGTSRWMQFVIVARPTESDGPAPECAMLL